jgi:hypothetical protein
MAKKLLEERIVELDGSFAAFTLGLMQDFLTFQKHCARIGITYEEVEGYVQHNALKEDKKTREITRVAELMGRRSPKCPVCKMQLILEPVNHNDASMVDDHSNSWWVCVDPGCEGESILSDKYPYEVLADLGVPVNRNAQEIADIKRKHISQLTPYEYIAGE